MRRGTRLAQRRGLARELARWITVAFLTTAGACADDDPEAIDPPPPLAESRVEAAPQPGPPRILLLLDTSGSMQARADCGCSTAGCSECLPSCEDGARSRWHLVLEALTGSFSTFGCRHQQRTASEGATYDRGYTIPNVALTPEVVQRDDGVLSRYAGRARFGVATFDSVPAYGASPLIPEPQFDQERSRDLDGMSSYAGTEPRPTTRPRERPDGSVVGRIYYPASAGPFLIDTGIRSEQASEGALVMPGTKETSFETQLRIQDQLLDVRPFGSSPTAAALDDVYFALLQYRDRAQDDTYVILITDGLPDDDYRNFPQPGCDCGSFEACGEDPSAMSCPYPLATDAAQHLRCGFQPGLCDGPATKVFVVGLLPPDAAVGQSLDAIAAAGGSEQAQLATDLASLKRTLEGIIDPLLSATALPIEIRNEP